MAWADSRDGTPLPRAVDAAALAALYASLGVPAPSAGFAADEAVSCLAESIAWSLGEDDGEDLGEDVNRICMAR